MADKASVMRIAFILYPLGIVLIWLFITVKWGIFSHLLIYFIVISLSIFGIILISLFGPKRYLYALDDWDIPSNQYHPEDFDHSKWNLLLDTHFHTKYSDGSMSIEQGVKWHIACGFNAFFITDHDTFANYEEIIQLQAKYKDQILIMPGIEIATPIGHMNVLGIHEWDCDHFTHPKVEDDIKKIILEAHRLGGVVTWNHFPWSTGGKIPRYKIHPTREQLIEWNVDLLECCNWDDDISPIDVESYEFTRNHSEIGPVAATDVHTPEKDRLYGWTLVNIPEFTPNALMTELRSKRTDVLLKPQGIPYPTTHRENPKIWGLKPIYQLGAIFLSIHRGGALSNVDLKLIFIWLIYFLVIFGFLELFFLIL
jgi:hypothetical protein